MISTIGEKYGLFFVCEEAHSVCVPVYMFACA